ncbi:MAG: AMP-binding protein [Halioglobus sp.]
MNKLDLSNTGDRVFGKILRAQAKACPQTPFLVTDDLSITFSEAEDITNRLAGGLRGLGVGRGDRVALFLGNRPEMVLLALAVNKLGAIWTPINTEYKGAWLADTIRCCRITVLVVDEPLQQRIADVEGSLQDVFSTVLLGDPLSSPLSTPVSYQTLCEHEPLVLDYEDQHYGDTCAILWTSGTTGKSKGVMQSYNAWIRSIVKGSSIQYDSRDGDVIYCALPLYNSGAWITSILRALLEGIPVVIEERFSVNQFWLRIARFEATQTFVLGAMGVFLLNAPAGAEDDRTSLQTAQIVPLPAPMWQPFAERFGLRLLRTGFGQSECLLVLTQLEAREDVPVYALGFPVDDADVCLLDAQGQEVADGEVGEISVKPLEPHVLFNGYFDAPEATRQTWSGPWYRTGDLGRKDPVSGAFFFVDRKKDAVRYAGRNISTVEVESVIGRHPAVQEVAAFGIPSAEVDSEDELKIDIVLAPGQNASHEQLCGFINDNAPHYFVPRYMEFVDSLPYTPTNKVQKFKLREKGIGENSWDIKNSNYEVRR